MILNAEWKRKKIIRLMRKTCWKKIIAEKWLRAKWCNRFSGRRIRSMMTTLKCMKMIRAKKSKNYFTHPLRPANKKKPAGQPKILRLPILFHQKAFADYIGGFAVSTRIRHWWKSLQRSKKDHDDYNAIMLKAIADRPRGKHLQSSCHKRVAHGILGLCEKMKTSPPEQIVRERICRHSSRAGISWHVRSTQKNVLQFDFIRSGKKIQELSWTDSYGHVSNRSK